MVEVFALGFVFAASTSAIAIVAIREQRRLVDRLLQHVEETRPIGNSTTAKLAELQLEAQLEEAQSRREIQRARMEAAKADLEGALS